MEERALSSFATSATMSHDAPLSIMHILAPADVGGLERVVQMLSIAQKRRGHAVRVVASISPGTNCMPFIQPMREAGVRVEVLTVGAKHYLAERSLVAGLLRREHTHIVHTHGFRPDVLHFGVARAAGVAVVSTLHGSERLPGITRLYEWLQERTVRRFDAVIAVSRPLGERLIDIGIPPDRLHTVPNGWSRVCQPVDRESARGALGLEGDGPVIGWVGRLVPAKGCDIFLDALARLEGTDVRAVVIGDGPLRAALEQRAGSLNLLGRVKFLGNRQDASRFFTAFDLFVLSSRTEGTPIVLFEAMSAGVPIVATTVGGVPDVLTEAIGVLVPPLSPRALADGIRATLAAPAEAIRRGLIATEHLLQEYGEEKWLERHDQIYRSVVRTSS